MSNDVTSDRETVKRVLAGSKVIYFQIEEITFAIPEKSLLDSEFFADLLGSKHLGEPKEGDLDNPIKLSGITAADVNSFMKILDTRDWEPPVSLNPTEWTTVLRLSTMWSFRRVRVYIIRRIENLPSLDPVWRIELARNFDIPKWLHPMYARLCMREEYLSAEDGIRLGIHTFAGLCKIREQMKMHQLRTAEKKIHQVENCNHRSSKVVQRQVCSQCITYSDSGISESTVLSAIGQAPELAVSASV